MSRRVEVLVIGGGLAGAAAAIPLAQAGLQVLLLEREHEARHKVCGEFLSAEALGMLRDMGIEPAVLGAVPIRGVRLCAGQGAVESRLPFAAMSLTRRRLDAAMLEAAEAAGVEVRRGMTVESLAPDGGIWVAGVGAGELVRTDRVVMASGKHDLRGYPRPRGPQGNLVGIKMYWRLRPEQQAALGQNVELLLFPGGYAGLEPVEDGVANLCCLFSRGTLVTMGWQGALAHMRASCSQARERLKDAEPLLDKPLAISAIPYGFVRREAFGERVWAVGDQAAVIPSFTGDGMSIALYSGRRAAASLLTGESTSDFQNGMWAELRWQVARATVLSRGLMREPSKRAIVAAVRLWPGLMRGVATATRIPAVMRSAPQGSVEVR